MVMMVVMMVVMMMMMVVVMNAMVVMSAVCHEATHPHIHHPPPTSHCPLAHPCTYLICSHDVDDPTLEQCRQPGLVAALSIEAQGLLNRWS